MAEYADRGAYEEHVATPPGIDVEAIVGAAGRVRVVRTDRRENVRLHREAVARVAQSLV